MPEFDFGKYMEPVARLLWGEPNKHMSKPQVELRFGNHGARSVDLKKGTWFEHGAEGGGVLDLIVREGKADDRRGAVEWLRDNGFDVPGNQRPASDSNRSYGPNGGDNGPPWQQVATWDYVDEKGAFLFQVVRMENGLTSKDGKPEKTYRQRTKDAKGNWNWKVKGIRMVPYRLPELLEDVRDGAIIFINEGEKACDLLRENGVPATTGAGGAGKWKPEYSEFFRGARVVIVRDNDPQATNNDGSLKFHPDGRPVFVGQDHGDDIARNLHGIAEEIRILDLPNLPPKGDVVEWWHDGGSIGELYELAAKAPKFEPKPFQSQFGLIRWEDQFKQAERPYEFQVTGIIPRRETVLWFGESQSGKSFSAFDAAVHVASGMEYQGKRTRKGGVVYCFVEKGQGARNRMQAFRQFHGLPLENFPFAALTKRFDIFASEETIDQLAAECLEIAKAWDVPLDVIVIDTHDKATPGASEIDKKDVSTILSRYERLRDRAKTGVWIIGHSNSFGSARGSLVLYNAIETVISISVMRDKQLGEFRDANQRVIRQAKVMKQSEGEAGLTWKFVLPAIEVARNEYNEPITSCVVTDPAKEEGEPTIDKGFKPSSNDSLFLKALLEAINDHGAAPSPMLALPPSITRVVDYTYVKEAFKDLNPDDGDDAAKWRERLKAGLRRARERLLDHRIIGVSSPYIWITGKPVRGIIRAKSAPPLAPSDEEMSAGMREVMATGGDIQI